MDQSRQDRKDAADCRKTLDDAIQRKDRYDGKAVIVLSLLNERCEEHIVREMTDITTRNTGNTTTALQEFLAHLRLNYFGDAYTRRTQLDEYKQ